MSRPKDGMFQRFTEPVMDQICALVPAFHDAPEAQTFYKRLLRYKRFKTLAEASRAAGGAVDTLPLAIYFESRPYRCSYQPHAGQIALAPNRENPMELLHIVAHYLQPGEGAWHGGEFGSIFLNLIERMFDSETKAAAKNIMLANKIKTSTRSAGTREKQSDAFYKRKVARAPEGLRAIADEMIELRARFGRE